jgi:hypothetical protein
MQPLTVVMDPRSSATPNVLHAQQETGLRMYADSLRSRQAMAEIQSVQKELDDRKTQTTGNSALFASVDRLQGLIAQVVNGNKKISGLQDANANLSAALAVVESGDRTIPAQALELYRQAKEAMNQRVEQWHMLKRTQLEPLNRDLQKAKIKPVQISSIEKEVFYQMTR